MLKDDSLSSFLHLLSSSNTTQTMSRSPTKSRPTLDSPSRAPLSALSSLNNLSISSPTRSKPAFPRSKPAVSTTQTTRKKSASPKKSRRTATGGEDLTGDLTGNLTGTFDVPSRKGSPTKLAANGGIGRSGVVSNDWDPSTLAGDSKRSPSKKTKNVSQLSLYLSLFLSLSCTELRVLYIAGSLHPI